MSSATHPSGHGEVSRILFSAEQIAERVANLAAGIDDHFGPGAEVLVVPVLTGALLFTADLVRLMQTRVLIDPVAVRSYHGAATRSGKADFRLPPMEDFTGKNVLLIDDIHDSGQTIRLLQDWIAAAGPADCQTCVLLQKDRPDLTHPRSDVQWVGFNLPDEFVVGYGLDYNGRYRDLPYIGILEQ